MKPFRFLILSGLAITVLLLLALKDFKGPEIVSVDMNLLARERAGILAGQNLNQDFLNQAIQKSTELLNQDLKAFAKDKKLIVMASNALKGGAEDVTEEFKSYVSHKKGDKA